MAVMSLAKIYLILNCNRRLEKALSIATKRIGDNVH